MKMIMLDLICLERWRSWCVSSLDIATKKNPLYNMLHEPQLPRRLNPDATVWWPMPLNAAAKANAAGSDAGCPCRVDQGQWLGTTSCDCPTVVGDETQNYIYIYGCLWIAPYKLRGVHHPPLVAPAWYVRYIIYIICDPGSFRYYFVTLYISQTTIFKK